MIVDTIAAIATPMLPSAIGILRISGTNSPQIVKELFQKSFDLLTPRHLYHAPIFDPETNNVIDDCCFIIFKDQASYTGEPSLEIYCHGSVYIQKKILTIITSQEGCRLAKNGEFTERAFINGKINLAKAESIVDLIESKNETSHEIALSQYNGKVYQNITSYRNQMMAILQEIEASLEFPDEVGNINTTKIQTTLSNISSDIEKIISNSDYGTYLKNGIKFLIIGQTNVGKSSLLNTISGENRSIVSNEAGTTRDYIDLSIEYKGILMTLIDTAGIRDTNNNIEKIGIEKINELSSTVDGYIFILDGSSPITVNDKQTPSFIDQKKPIISVINKIDILDPKNKPISQDDHYLKISTTTKSGIDQLKHTMVNSFVDTNYEPDQILSNIRQISCLKSAQKSLLTIQENLKNNMTLDVLTIDLRTIISNLSELIGENFTEELLDGIFSRFCIGK